SGRASGDRANCVRSIAGARTGAVHRRRISRDRAAGADRLPASAKRGPPLGCGRPAAAACRRRPSALGTHRTAAVLRFQGHEGNRRSFMKRAIAGLFIALILGAPAAHAQTENKIQLIIRPTAAPEPALKYRLLPELEDMEPGNAA